MCGVCCSCDDGCHGGEKSERVWDAFKSIRILTSGARHYCTFMDYANKYVDARNSMIVF